VLEDAASNIAAASSAVTLTVDYVVPTVTVRSSATTLKNGATATITVTTSESTEDLASIDLTATGGTLTGFNGSGTDYTATLTPTAAASATATVKTVAGSFSDVNGNPSAVSNTVSITVDTVAPSAPVITGPALTNDTTPTITGTAEANSLVSIYDGSTLLGAATADGTGAWTFTPANALTSGSHSVTATATDSVGNIGITNSPAYALVLDVTPPVVALNPVAGNDEILLA
jgi:hypothetical protein